MILISALLSQDSAECYSKDCFFVVSAIHPVE